MILVIGVINYIVTFYMANSISEISIMHLSALFVKDLIASATVSAVICFSSHLNTTWSLS